MPLTLVVAQAGAGKTVLLNQWQAEHPDLTFVWLGVEYADDDPVRFSRRLLSEFGAARPEVLHLAHLSALSAGGLGKPLVEGFLRFHVAARMGGLSRSCLCVAAPSEVDQLGGHA